MSERHNKYTSEWGGNFFYNLIETLITVWFGTILTWP